MGDGKERALKVMQDAQARLGEANKIAKGAQKKCEWSAKVAAEGISDPKALPTSVARSRCAAASREKVARSAEWLEARIAYDKAARSDHLDGYHQIADDDMPE